MRISLDTCYLEGLNEKCLNELQKRGFVISTSLLSLHEMWTRSFRENNKNLLCNRMKILLKYLDREIPVIPYGIELKKEIENKFTKSKDLKLNKKNVNEFYKNFNYQLLVKITTMTDAEWKEDGLFLKKEIDKSATNTKKLFERGSLKKKELGFISNKNDEKDHFDFLKLSSHHLFGDAIHKKLHKKYDAWMAWWTLAVIRSPERYSYEENDDVDMQLLTQIAFPTLLLTKDRRFLNFIHSDDSKKSWVKTHQSPWIKTFGELITDPLPTGVPWGKSAKKQAALYTRRSRSEIHLLEEFVIKSINSK